MSFSGASSQLNINTGDACICLCGLKFKQQKKETLPDHLKNWEVWMQRRKQIHEILTKRLECEPGDLLMNSGDTCRKVKEEKLILYYTKIENHFDKYRGNPDFWTLPRSLKSHTPPYKGTEYFVVKSKEEKNEIPGIEYVVVPDFILEEKNLKPRTRSLKTLWSKSSYREKVVDRISEKLQEIEPHKPDLSQLIILGSGIKAKSQDSSSPISKRTSRALKVDVTDVKSDNVSIVQKESDISLPTSVRKLSLKINNIQFNDTCDFAHKENKISIIFQHFTDSMLPDQQSILFENTGYVALRIYWQQYKKLKIFREYTEKTNIFHPYKFNKNELLLLPGMSKEIHIWFQVEKPGNYFEYWEIACLPKIWKSDFRLIILLKGFAFIRDYEQRVQQISEKLRQGVRNTKVKDLLNDVICRGNYCTPNATQTFNFSEKELFESVNLIRSTESQIPKYIYNSTLIAELKRFYKKIRFPGDPEQWNLSIQKLSKIARKRDMFMYFENRLALYHTAKLNRKYLQENAINTQSKPGTKKEKEGTKKQIEKKKKDSLVEPTEKKQIMNCYNNLREIIRKLEKPSMYINEEREKYLFSYIIIKTYFWKMFDQLDKLDNNLTNDDKENGQNDECKEIKQSFQSLPVPDRLLHERFDECYILRTKRISYEPGISNAKPKSLLLKGIAFNDTKKIFKTYFSKDETNQKAMKGKTQANEIKKPKGQKNKNPINQEEDLYLSVNEYFNPFSEYFPCIYETTKKIDFPDTSPTFPEKTNEDKYLIVYVTLCNAVDALVDAIEGFDRRNISSDTLGELQKCDKTFSTLKYESEINLNNGEITEKSSQSTIHSSGVSKMSQKKSSLDSQADYFKFLKELHWQTNLKAKKYFVNGKQKSSTDIDVRKSDIELDTESKVKQSVLNIFSLEDFRRKSEPYCLKDRAAQTETLLEDYSETHSLQEVTHREISVESLEGSKNLFYFLNANNAEKKSEDALLKQITTNK